MRIHLLALSVLLLGGVTETAAAVTPTADSVRTHGASQASSPDPTFSAAGFRMVKRPSGAYTGTACFTDLSTVPDGSPVDLLVNDCGFQIALSTTTVKQSVPATWQRWARPPRVESARPDVLYTDGASSVTLSWGSENTIGGVEVQPRKHGREAFEASFYTGPNGTGTLVGTVTRRQVFAPGGARLLAAKSSVSWQSMVITDLAGRDFAIAELRGS